MSTLPEVFVGDIGLHSVTLCGSKCSEYLDLPNARLVRDCVVIECGTEENMLELLQALVSKSIPFEATYKSQAARDALFYREKGLLKGEIISFDWCAAGAVCEKL